MTVEEYCIQTMSCYFEIDQNMSGGNRAWKDRIQEGARKVQKGSKRTWSKINAKSAKRFMRVNLDKDEEMSAHPKSKACSVIE